MANMDVFNSDAFDSISMTDALNKVDHLPSLLGDMNLFSPSPVRTDRVTIEEQNNSLSLVPTSDRGAPLEEGSRERRTLRDFRTVRLAKGDTIMADEIQNIRAFGSESELMQVQEEVARRQMRLRRDIELTWENMRLGAVQGKVVDADGSTTIVDFYSEFGVTEPSEVNFALGTSGTDVQSKCAQIVRAMAKEAKGVFTPQTRVIGLAGDNFFDQLANHPNVKQAYENQQSQQLRANLAYQILDFGGIRFINYRGTDDNSTVAVGTDKCKFFPENAPGMFEVAYSPAETFDFANTPGQPVYSLLVRDQQRNMWVRPEVYSYPLFYVTRPKALQSARKS